MEHDPSRSTPRNTRKARSGDANPVTAQGGGANRVSNQDAALLAQFAATASPGLNSEHSYSHALSPTQYPNLGPAPGFYGNFFHHDSMSQSASLPPLSSLDFPWSQLPPQQHTLGHYDQQLGSSTTAATSSTTFVPSQYHSAQSMPQDSPSPPASTSGTSIRASGGRSRSGTNAEELTEAERAAIAEEKRRRNTAASARFRIKKKQKTVNLERSVSDLTGRAEELEREVADLRRENGWLKEIVMLKGTRFAAANLSHRTALSQAAALAVAQPGTSASAGDEGSSSNQYEDDEDAESDSDDDDNRKEDKGKGKATGSSSKH